MKTLTEKTLVPISITVAAVLTFGVASFNVGSFYTQAQTDSVAVLRTADQVAAIQASVTSIMTDVALIKQDLKRLTPPTVSFETRKPATSQHRAYRAPGERQASLYGW